MTVCVRRLLQLMLAVAVAGGCSPVSAPTSAARSSPSRALTPIESAAPASPGVVAVPGDLFTAPAGPLAVSVTADTTRSANATLGPKGGKIVATGADGTTYTLIVPPNALLFDETLALTPLSDVTGLGVTDAPNNRLGVQLAPDGLELFQPASLTIEPPSLPGDAPVSTLAYRGAGTDARLTLFRKDTKAITLQVDHFSGYSAFWPVDAEWWRVAERLRQAQAEERLANVIAAEVGKLQQLVREGAEPKFGMLEILLEYLPVWDRDVIRPALERAHNGCDEASHAVAAYLGWLRQLSLLRVMYPGLDDSRLQRPIPPDLVILKRDLCFEEQFQRCRLTGDFEGLMGFFLSFFSQYEYMGLEPSQDDIDLAHRYLERCGLWDVMVETIDVNYQDNRGDLHLKHTYRIKWTPGSALYGLLDSRARGERGVLEVLDYRVTISGGPGPCPGAVIKGRNFQIQNPGAAEILRLRFDRSPSGAAIPRELQLELTWGSFMFQHVGKCAGQSDNSYGDLSEAAGLASTLFDYGPHDGTLIDSRWQFDDGPFHEGPFSAHMTATRQFHRDSGELEVTITHVPAP